MSHEHHPHEDNSADEAVHEPVKKPRKHRKRRGRVLVALLLIILLSAGIVVAAIILATQSESRQLSDLQCTKFNQELHTISIEDDRPDPTTINAKQCDQVTVTNKDDVIRLMAFGPHDAHVPYDNIGEKPLDSGQSFTFTLVQPGKVELHDHVHDEVVVTLNITPRH